MPMIGAGDVRRQRGSGAAAQLFDLGKDEPAHFGNDPGADGEVGAAQAEDYQRRRNGNETGNRAGQHDRRDQIETGHDGKRKQRIGADADEGLLAHGNQPGATGKQIPELRQSQHGEHVEQLLQQHTTGKRR